MKAKLTLEQICKSLSLWLKYIDIDGLNTRRAFRSMPYEERLDIAQTLYWYEGDDTFGEAEQRN